MTFPPVAQTALEAFSACTSWEQRARLLMQWGEQLTPLTDAERCEEHRVHGCESAVWLVNDSLQPCLHFRASSDARLLRGLLALLLVRVNGATAAELPQIDITQWFQQLGLSRQLSPSRTNGLNAVLKRIQALSA